MNNGMKVIIIVAIVINIVVIFSTIFKSTNGYFMEYAYFEGQKDYINKDVRVKKEGDKYFWIKSPWDNNDEPKYNPNK